MHKYGNLGLMRRILAACLFCVAILATSAPVFAGQSSHESAIFAEYDHCTQQWLTSIEAGDYKTAEAAANKQLDMDPSDSQAFLRLAIAVRLDGDAETASSLLDHALVRIGEGDADEIRLKSMAAAILRDAQRGADQK